ncbi:MAG: hypothetical protein ACI9NN_001875 [Bacteroidia bacterium]|jgi:hypothetical protein
MVVFALFTMSSTIAGGPSGDFDAANFTAKMSVSHPAVGDTIEIVLTTTLPENLHIYGVVNECNGIGPLPPFWENIELVDMEMVGDLYHGSEAEIVTDDIFECDLSMFSHKAEFRQKVKITGHHTNFKANFTYQMCSDALCKSFTYQAVIGHQH